MALMSASEFAATGSESTRLFQTFVLGKSGQFDVGGAATAGRPMPLTATSSASRSVADRARETDANLVTRRIRPARPPTVNHPIGCSSWPDQAAARSARLQEGGAAHVDARTVRDGAPSG